MAKDELSGTEGYEDAYALDATLYEDVIAAVDAGDEGRLDALFEPLHPADIADLLEQMSSGERAELLGAYSRAIDGEVLSDLDEVLREEVISLLPEGALAEAVRDLESDDVVDLLEDIEDAGQQQAILGALDDDDRAAVEAALSYPEESAGRLMQTEVVRVPEFWSVGETIDFLRSQTEDLPEQFYHVILVDPRMKPVGNVTLGRLLSTPRPVMMRDLVEEMFRTIPADQPQADVAYAFNQYHLISAPVVDADGRLVGVITIDDAMIVLEEEAEEDILRLAGVGDSSLSDRILETTKRRFPWLFVNLITAILASAVIAQFEETIAQFVALAVLMPIVASMGGNAGTQSLTVAVRAIATRDLTGSNLMRVVLREAGAGLINGLAFALVMGLVGYFWFASAALGGVIAVAMVINLVIAGLAGVLVPVTLERLKIDPALASGAFVTTVTDIVGFFAFLGLAAVVLL